MDAMASPFIRAMGGSRAKFKLERTNQRWTRVSTPSEPSDEEEG
jgi:hypothetical protein